MSTPQDPRREIISAYMVRDHNSSDEFKRVMIQDQMLTTAMGGVWLEQQEPISFQRVLDVGCGAGAWLLEAARVYPAITLLVGVDVNQRLIEYARAQAAEQQPKDRVEFHVMDALRMLEFPTAFFDLVNQRLGSSYLRTWDWSKLLHEYQRVTRPGGVIRITESDIVTESTSPAFLRFNQLILQALTQAGYAFAIDGEGVGVSNQLVSMLQKCDLQNVQQREHVLEYHGGTPQGQLYYEDAQYASRTMLPFLQKWSRVPDDYEALCQQMLNEMQQTDFVATWRFLTAWGNNPERP